MAQGQSQSNIIANLVGSLLQTKNPQPVVTSGGQPINVIQQPQAQVPVNNPQPVPVQNPQPVQQGSVQQNVQQTPPQGMKGNLQRLLAGYNENYNNSLANSNMFTPQQDQYGQTIGADKWGRTGEALGSIARIAQNPTAQMLIAALVSKKFNPRANWANALENGYKYGQMAGERQSNQQILNQIGYPVNNGGLFGGASDNAMKAVYQDAYNRGRLINQADRNNTYTQDVNNKNQHWQRQDANQTKDVNSKIERRKSQNSTDKINAGANVTRANANATKAEAYKNGVNDRINHPEKYQNNNKTTSAKSEIKEAVKRGDGIIMIDPQGNEQFVGSNRVQEAINRGYIAK